MECKHAGYYYAKFKMALNTSSTKNDNFEHRKIKAVCI